MPPIHNQSDEESIPVYLSPEALKQFSLAQGLFHEETIIDIRLCEDPPDEIEIDIDAVMAQEKACFVTRDTVYVTKKKSLLISSWYFELMDENRREKTIQLLDQLIQAGHPVYIPTAEGLQSVNTLVTLRSQIIKLIPVSQEIAFRMAASKGLTRDSVCLVDTPRLQTMLHHFNHRHQAYEPSSSNYALLSDNLTEFDIDNIERRISTDDGLSITFPSETNQLISQKSPELSDKVRHLTINSTAKVEEIMEILKQFRQLEHLQLNNLCVSELELLSFLNKSNPDILTLNTCLIDGAAEQAMLEKMYRSGRTLRQLYLNDCSRNDGIHNLLEFNPGLTDLSLYNCDLGPWEFTLAPRHLEKLRYLNLDKTVITKQQRDNLAYAAPNLVHLGVATSTLISEGLVPVPIWLAQWVTGQSGNVGWHQMSRLNMSGSAPTVDAMLAIMQSLRSLVSFEANESLHTNDWLKGLVAANAGSNTLRDLYLKKTDINGEGLQALFTLYPNLPTLSLRGCESLDQGSSKLIFSGKRGQLSYLDASRSSLTQEQLTAILQAEPNLSVLNLGNCKNQFDFSQLRLKPGQLARLTELDLSGCHYLSEDHFKSLWMAAPNLRKLSIHDSIVRFPDSQPPGQLREFRAQLISLQKGSFQTIIEANPNLCHLDISLCSIDLDSLFIKRGPSLMALTTVTTSSNPPITLIQLGELLQAAGNLRRLEVADLRVTEPLQDFRSIHHELLETLIIRKGGIPKRFLFNLLENSPALKRLDLVITPASDNYQTLERLEPGSLPKLTALNITQISSTDLMRTLIYAAPNLKTLSFRNCHFSDSMVLKLQRKHLRKLTSLDVSWSNITGKQLQSIIEASPRVTQVDIGQCNQLSEEDFNYFKQQYPDIGFTGTPIFIRGLLFKRGLSNKQGGPGRGAASSSSSSSGSSSCLATETKFLPRQASMIMPTGDFKQDRISTFHTKTIFISRSERFKINTHFYHLSAYRWDGELQVFMPYTPDEDNLVPVMPMSLPLSDMKYKLDSYDLSHYRAQFEYQSLDPKTWYQLPATSTKDILKAFASSISTQSIDLRQDKETGYHYFRVKHPENRSVLISYIQETGLGKGDDLSMTREVDALLPLIARLRFSPEGGLIENRSFRKLMQAPEGARIAALKAFCSFEEESGYDFLGSPIECLNYSIIHRRGACRHRGQLFTALATELGISSWYVVNECHAFAIAAENNGEKFTIQLGGAAAEVIPSEAPTDEVIDSYEEIEDKLPGAPVHIPRIPIPHPHNRYQIWNTDPLQAGNAHSLANELISKSHNLIQQLVVTENNEGIEALHQAVLRDHSYSQHCLFTCHLDGVSLTSSHVAADGSCQKLPSPLDQFITLARNNPNEIFTWFINWSDAEAKHGSLNSLIARQRQLHGLALPDNLHLVVLMDKASLGKMGRQFTSCLKNRSLAPEISPPERAPQPERLIGAGDVVIAIPSDWKKELLGRPSIQGSQVTILPGALLQAIANGAQSIRIHNPPMENEAFRLFRTELEETRGFYFNGIHHQLPPGCTLEFVTAIIDFSTERLQALFRENDSLVKSTINLSLNTATYNDFFSTTHAGETGLYSQAGLLETYRDRRICLYITDTLTELQWYKVVTEAEKLGVALTIKATPGGRVPLALQPFVKSLDALNSAYPVTLFHTNDVDYILAKIGADLVIPISGDTRFESLFIHLTRDEQGLFTGKETDLLRAIREGKDIAFKGNFSKVLVQKLQSLFLGEPPALMVNGESIPISGQLNLITEEDKPFTEISCNKIHFNPEIQFKQLMIGPRNRLLRYYRELNITPCYSHFKDCPEGGQEQMIWVTALGTALHLAAGKPFPIPSEMRASSSSSTVETPTATTPQEFLEHLDKKPFVFLISESGSGKSHFMQQVIPQYGRETGRPITVYNKLSDIEKWLNHKDGIAILFLDEANLSTEDYLIFDNLARGERVIWLKGKRYELSEGQKVVFAGNPYGYGGRKEADLFRRFPNYLEYRGESLEKILQPLMGTFKNQAEAFKLINSYYRQALQSGLNITPRNALMICLRVGEMKLSPAFHHFSDELLLQHAISHELKSLTTDKKTSHDLRQQLKTDPLWLAQGDALKTRLKERLPKLGSKDYVWTPSRQKIALVLLALLNIRQQKIEGHVDPSHGINGFLLEGMEGLGKSRLLTALLKELNLPVVTISLENPQEARKQLIEAFHNGQIVIINKLNTMADEKLLNDLLSGIDPDTKMPARKPGFFVLATQNPISSEKTNKLSIALENRFVTLALKEYSIAELQHILSTTFSLSPAEIDAHLQELQHAVDYARQEGLEPLPNTGTLFTTIQEELAESPDASEERLTNSYPGS